MRKRRNKKRKSFYVLAVFLLLLSIGYATFSVVLKTRGSFGIVPSKMEIIWQNPKLSDGSVSGDVSIDNETKTTASFTANLKEPGDYHKFTIEAANKSDIDAMVKTINTTLYKEENGVETEIQKPNYIEYTFMYSDGTLIQPKQLLKKHSTDTYVVKMELSKNINANDLPGDSITLRTDFTVTYSHATEEAIERPTSNINIDVPATLKRGTTVNNMMANMVYQQVKDEYVSEDPDKYSMNQCDLFNGNDDSNCNYGYYSYVRSINRASRQQYNSIKNELTEDNIVSLSENRSEYQHYKIATSASIEIDEIDSPPVYMWFDRSSGTIYYYSDSEKIYLNSDSFALFYGFHEAEHIDLSGFDTSRVKNMSYMFGACDSLLDLDLSGFDTRKVIDMSYMFENAKVSGTLDLSNFDVSKVKDFTYMFRYGPADGNYSSIVMDKLNISNWKFLATPSARNLFSGSLFETIIMNNVDTSGLTDMSEMFSGCSYLQNLNLSSWNTSNVTDMTSMFEHCSSLENLNLSNFNTSKVTSMNSMFGDCSMLSELNLDSFSADNLLLMSGMFYGCYELRTLTFSNFNSSKVTDMSHLFSGCYELRNFDLSSINTSNVTNMAYMFNNCDLTTFDLSVFDTSSATNMSHMFEDCNLLNVNLSCLDTSNVTDMSNMFYYARVSNLSLNGLDTSSVTDMSHMFEKSSINALDLSRFNLLKVTDMNNMFYGCTYLESLNFSGANLSKVKYMYYMLYGCTKLKNLDLSNVTIQDLTSTSSMFSGCSKLETLNLSGFNTSNVTSMSGMFSGCKALTTLTLTNLNTSNVIYMDSMFYDCNNLSTLNLSSFNTSKVTSMVSMFYKCSSLSTLNLSNFITSDVTSMASMFSGCSGLTSLNISEFDTSKVKYMNSMFNGCSGLTSLNLSNFITSNVTNMESMFKGCSGLTSLDLDGFDTYKVTDMESMFEGCTGLTELDLTLFNTYNLYKMAKMFYNDYNLVTIYVSNKWTTAKVNTGGWSTSYTNVFYNCTSLVGGNGTVFNSSKTDKEYARIDTVDEPGYLSAKNKWVLVNRATIGNPADHLSEQRWSYYENGVRKESGFYILEDLYGIQQKYFFVDGIAQIGWLNYEGNYYYLSDEDDDGNGYVNCGAFRSATEGTTVTKIIDNQSYEFDSDGKCTNYNGPSVKSIFFDSNGGSLFPNIVNITTNNIGTLPTPTKVGYQFLGWYTGLTDGVKIDSTYIPTNNQTLYARWRY